MSSTQTRFTTGTNLVHLMSHQPSPRELRHRSVNPPTTTPAASGSASDIYITNGSAATTATQESPLFDWETMGISSDQRG
ncbi:hypothetical protein BDBG_04760 [Blastomyces gilchristii SLH14081]|uniref:Uncharacterized protein n=1 Tax=Blastomyces gilchristii (strain SLH14081) TaxID=559298 RepID=A0A179UPU3_BLAGS|nr:uncharacterized protein BDBG_04760 [Blastomyces gilchristii SLH14081]OAT09218.1 hypothetical protein BDBG_04760 [Blastomyces gilchristii SLH14081]